MIFGAHVVVFSTDPEADRALLADVLGLASVDAGNGWLIFALPPAEAAVHPGDATNGADLSFMSDDLATDMAALERTGLQFEAIEEARWGSITRFTLPGGSRVGLYQPRHPSPLATP
jgi:hypothetical protein